MGALQRKHQRSMAKTCASSAVLAVIDLGAALGVGVPTLTAIAQLLIILLCGCVVFVVWLLPGSRAEVGAPADGRSRTRAGSKLGLRKRLAASSVTLGRNRFVLRLN